MMDIDLGCRKRGRGSSCTKNMGNMDLLAECGGQQIEQSSLCIAFLSPFLLLLKQMLALDQSLHPINCAFCSPVYPDAGLLPLCHSDCTAAFDNVSLCRDFTLLTDSSHKHTHTHISSWLSFSVVTGVCHCFTCAPFGAHLAACT